MIIGQQARNIQSSGLGESKSFNIKASAKAFEILSSTIYKDKIRAIVRELSCNAADSHIMAGSTKPFQVYLPTDLSPQFTVRDFGTGMTPEQIESLYSTYFESTKENTNDQTGALGIGSKSPFAYVDSFTVVSIIDGKKYTYLCYKGSDGAPAVSQVSSRESDEETGVSVSMAVKPEHFQAFRNAALSALSAFEIKPEVKGWNFDFINISGDEIVEGVRIINNSEISKLTVNRSDVIVIQGNVAYPVNHDSVNLKTIKSCVLNPYNTYIIIDMPIGTVDFAPSREEIDYTQRTISNINNKIDEIEKVLEQKVLDEFNDIKTRFEMNSKVDELSNDKFKSWMVNYSSNKIVINQYSLACKRLNTVVDKDALFKYNPMVYVKKWTETRKSNVRTITRGSYPNYTEHYNVSCNVKLILNIDDNTRFLKKIKKEVQELCNNDEVLVLRNVPHSEMPAISKLIGDTPWMNSSSIIVAKTENETRKYPTKGLFERDTYGNLTATDYDIDLGGVYYDTRYGEVTGAIGTRTIDNLMKWKGIRIFNSQTKTVQQRLISRDNWVTVEEYIKTVIDKDLIDLISKHYEYHSVYVREGVMQIAELVGGEYLDRINHIQSVKDKVSSELEKIRETEPHKYSFHAGRYSHDVKVDITPQDVDNVVNDMINAYPILKLLGSLDYEVNDTKLEILKQYIKTEG